MEQEQSFRLYTQGLEAWNSWAERMLTQRDELKANGLWMEELDSEEIFNLRASDTVMPPNLVRQRKNVGGVNNFV